MQKRMHNAVLVNRIRGKLSAEFKHPKDVVSMVDLLRISKKLHPPSI